ncbi:MAG: diaminopimelate epimerase, partial [Myxococcota bacterium]
ERDPALRRPRFAVDTGAGSLLCEITSDGDIAQTVTVDMGRPRLGLSEIPMSPSALSPDAGATADGARFVAQPLSAAGRELSATAVSMGNPHVISFVSESSSALRTVAETIGPAVETHPWFPEKTNVEFAHVHSPNEIELVVWERGCGITLACGTGACATAVAACLTGQARAGEEIRVRLLGGDLQITVDHDLRTVHMRGPATRVFDAEFAPSFLASAR